MATQTHTTTAAVKRKARIEAAAAIVVFAVAAVVAAWVAPKLTDNGTLVTVITAAVTAVCLNAGIRRYRTTIGHH